MELPDTEQRSSDPRALDLLDPEGLAEVFSAHDQQAVDAVRGARAEIAQAIDMARKALGAGGRLLLSGAGTSGRLAVIEAAECWPTFSSDRVQALIAGGSQAFLKAQEGAEDDRSQGGVEARALELGADDFFVGVAASGRTPFVWGTLEAAREAGSKTAILCCSPPAESWVDLAIVLETGSEALTGSTRLKAGTATKCALNAITTGAFSLLGKVMDNLMVDVVPTNAKLEIRARGIVQTLGGVQAERAQALLDAAEGQVKTAVLMARTGLDAEAARERLAASGGHLRRALEARP